VRAELAVAIADDVHRLELGRCEVSRLMRRAFNLS
jgi:hypothetical protein